MAGVDALVVLSARHHQMPGQTHIFRFFVVFNVVRLERAVAMGRHRMAVQNKDAPLH